MKEFFGVSTFALVAALGADPTLAQVAMPPAATAATDVDSRAIVDIIVTAQKRSERINSVPLAISAFGAGELASSGITDTAQLAKVIPSFNVLTSALGQPVFYIRGVGLNDSTVSISPTVSVYTDEIALPYSTMARGAAFDLERVEVLKGPQGTLFGQNSTGGAINYIAAKPTTSLAAGVDLEAGRFETVNASAFVSGPISDTLSGRIAIQNRHQGDWQSSITRPGDTRGQQKFSYGRAILDWSPSDVLSFSLTGSAWLDKSDTLAAQFIYLSPANLGPTANQAVLTALAAQPLAPRDNRVGDWDPGSRTAKDDRFYQATLRADYDLGRATITSLTGYADTTIDSPVDQDGTAFPNSFVIQEAHLKVLSQELRASGDFGARTHWLIGGNYQHAKTNERFNNTQLNASNNSIGPFVYNYVLITDNQTVDTYAGFASLDHKITDTVTLRASGRYTTEKRSFNGCLADSGDGNLARAFSLASSIFSGQPVTIAPGACVTLDDVTSLPVPIVRKSLDQDSFSWRVGVDWQASSNTLVYANVAKGYKSGGFTATPSVFVRQLQPVSQESVLAYEAGLKASLFQRRVQANFAAFYYDYKDKQLNGFVDIPPFGLLPTLVGIPKSRVYGAEADIKARLTTTLRLRLSGAYINTKATSVPPEPVAPLGGRYNFIGESFPDTPKYQVSADLEQRFPLGADTDAYVGGSVQYRSSASTSFGRTQNALTRSLFTIDAYTLVDVRAGVSFNDGKLTAELWGRNITDKFYVLGVGRSPDAVFRYNGMPATYGARLSWRY